MTETTGVREISFRVLGQPAPQGSKHAIVTNGRSVLVESSRHLRPWREAIKQAARDADAALGLSGPLQLRVTFILRRPTGHYGSGRNADTVKPSAPDHPHVKPDLDKLVRAVMDALTDVNVWRDDSQVCSIIAIKMYESRAIGAPGARITVHELGQRMT